MKANLKSFIVSYDRLEDKSVDMLTCNEKESLVCYTVQKSVPKKITGLVKSVENEWELPWNDYHYQSNKYYEYGAMVHILNNPRLVEGATHIGLFHYDVIFLSNSINGMRDHLQFRPNTIFYLMMQKDKVSMYLTPYELSQIVSFMNQRLGMNIDWNNVWENGWVGEAMSLVPRDVFLRFSRFLYENKSDIESIISENKWGIMNRVKHRVCGLVERMWGFYLVSCGMEMQRMNGVVHDWNSYTHKHLEQR